MQDRDEVPDYLWGTYDLLKCAFPNGISHEAYWPLMAILHPEMSFRTLAKVLSALTDKEYIEVLNDAAGFGLDPMPDLSEIEKVKERLIPCGYEEWLKQSRL